MFQTTLPVNVNWQNRPDRSMAGPRHTLFLLIYKDPVDAQLYDAAPLFAKFCITQNMCQSLATNERTNLEKMIPFVR